MDEAAGHNFHLEAFGAGAGAYDIDFVVALLDLHRHIDFAQVRDRSRANSEFDPVRRQARRAWRRAGSNPAAVAIATIPKPTGNGGAIAGSWKLLGIPAPVAETIEVDLDNYQVFRRSQMERLTPASEELSERGGAKLSGEPDDAQPGEKVISLPATRANLVLRLPETGVPGKYNVSLINAFGQSLLSNSAFSPDGARLKVTLDLRRFSRKKYRLRLWREGEAPAFYDVIIGAR